MQPKTKLFKREYLLEKLDLPYSSLVVSDKIIDKRRWTDLHQIVFKDLDGSYWRTSYLAGATELQETIPWEYEDEVWCVAVEKKIGFLL